MKITLLKEPLLEFGEGQSICPKEGISLFRPYDIHQRTRPSKINVGIIGRADSVDTILSWLDKATQLVEAKETTKTKLFPAFMGFNLNAGFGSELVYESDYIRKLKLSEFNSIQKKHEDMSNRIEEAVNLYVDEIRFLAKNKRPDVILCAIPESFIKFINDTSELPPPPEEPEESTLMNEPEIDNIEDILISEQESNFRRLLKAKAMFFGVPIQLVRDRIALPTRDMQDKATISWNFFTALYYKASGTPWALKRDNELTCYAGISFYRSRDKKTIQTSVAQIFNELGKGVILRGEPIKLQKNDRVPHLTEKYAYELLYQALSEYKEAIKSMPQRLSLHKTSKFNIEEIKGFEAAANRFQIDALDLITIPFRTNLRAFRTQGSYPPLRGSWVTLTSNRHLLYTRGTVPFFETYTGLYIPHPIEVQIFRNDESPETICKEILALTKMNWNNAQFDRRFPITIECARNVGDILKYVPQNIDPQLKYSFYM